ncbi:MAG: hydrogenase maturation protease [Terracidiphilus sp.]|nr:hydrogenase maturation protease [Terracidiphilus sp.]
MNAQPARCLILACGNTLREDDGIGPFLASWAEERFAATPGVRVLASHQWTPELAMDIAAAETVVFIDCAVNTPAGAVRLAPVVAAEQMPRLMTHHLDTTCLLALAREYYEASPRESVLLSIGAGSMELREGFSDVVRDAIPAAQRALEETVLRLLGEHA